MQPWQRPFAYAGEQVGVGGPVVGAVHNSGQSSTASRTRRREARSLWMEASLAVAFSSGKLGMTWQEFHRNLQERIAGDPRCQIAIPPKAAGAAQIGSLAPMTPPKASPASSSSAYEPNCPPPAIPPLLPPPPMMVPPPKTPPLVRERSVPYKCRPVPKLMDSKPKFAPSAPKFALAFAPAPKLSLTAPPEPKVKPVAVFSRAANAKARLTNFLKRVQKPPVLPADDHDDDGDGDVGFEPGSLMRLLDPISAESLLDMAVEIVIEDNEEDDSRGEWKPSGNV